MANTILKQVNDIGAVLGYPFYVYPDGTCGKSIVSGKMNAIGIVKKKFPVSELKSEFLNCSAENDEKVLKHLSQIGENIGFPFYVYADGGCGTNSQSLADGQPFVMFIKKKFLVEKLAFDVNNKASKATKNDQCLDETAELMMIDKSLDDVIKAYFEKDPLSHDVQCWMLEKCNDEVIISYIQKYSLCDDAQKLMLEKCGDDVVKAYRKKYDIASSLEGLIRKRYGFFWFLRV